MCQCKFTQQSHQWSFSVKSVHTHTNTHVHESLSGICSQHTLMSCDTLRVPGVPAPRPARGTRVYPQVGVLLKGQGAVEVMLSC